MTTTMTTMLGEYIGVVVKQDNVTDVSETLLKLHLSRESGVNAYLGEYT